MVLSETVQFVVIMAVTVIFSAFALAIEDKNYTRLVLKLIASFCWFILSLTQLYFFGASQMLAIPLTLMFLGIGLFYAFSIVNDFRLAKHDRIWSFSE